MDDVLKIVVVLPPYFAVSDAMGYGGTEKIALTQIRALALRGHELTVFAREGSQIEIPNVTLITYSTNGFDLQSVHPNEAIAVQLAIFAVVNGYISMNPQTDIIFDHTEGAIGVWYNHPQARKVVVQAHNDPARFGDMLTHASRQLNVVAISNAQRHQNDRNIRWSGTVHHGLPALELMPLEKPSRDYLACLGRFDEVKGFREATAVARASGLLLKIAAPLRDIDRPFFEEVVRPAVADGTVEYVGEVDLAGKQRLLQDARALLAIAKFPEPFGLYVIEAMACGTPVIGSDVGSLPELIQSHTNGIICPLLRDSDGVVDTAPFEAAVQSIERIDRASVRASFERRFTDTVMTEQLEKLFRKIIGRRLRRVA